MAVVLYLIALPIRACGVVHEHHIVVLHVYVEIFLIETLRSIFLRLLAVFAVCILRCPCEFGWRNSIYLCEHLIYNFQLLLFHFKELVLLCTIVMCLAQAKAEFTQLACQQR